MNNLTVRILSALVIIPPVLAIILWAPPIGFAMTAITLAAIAGWEFGNITFGATFPYHRFFLAGLSACVASSVALSENIPLAPIFALGITIPLAMISFMAVAKDMKVAAEGAAFASMGAIYTGGLFGAMSLLVTTNPNGNFWFLALLAGAIFNDTLAYTFGRLFGKRKMAPSISPKKTWAGAVGGVIGTIGALAAVKALFIPELAWWKIPIAGLAVSVSCQVGDLAESFIKRGFGVKDSGRIIPGHGGILDRCDALMFAAPVMLFLSLTN